MELPTRLPRSLPPVLGVGDGVLEHDAASADNDRNLDHFVAGRGAVPVLDAGRRVIELYGSEFLHRLATMLDAALALLDEHDEAACARGPVRPVARLEGATIDVGAFEPHRHGIAAAGSLKIG